MVVRILLQVESLGIDWLTAEPSTCSVQVTGLGGFAVVMFGVSSFGLALLTLKLLSAEKPPMQ